MNAQNVWFIIITYQPKGAALNTLKAVLNKNNVRIIENTSQKNPGYGGGANIGIRYALAQGAAWVVVCNQDIKISDTDVSLFIDTLKKSKPGLYGPEGGTLDKKRWTTILYKQENELHKATPPKKQKGGLGEIDYISGSFMAIHKNVIEKIGYFYEPYFMYYEDVDFSVRAHKAGFPVQCIPLAGYQHESNANNERNRKEYYLARNHLLFDERNAPWRVKEHELLRLPKTVFDHANRKNTGALYGIRDYLLRRFGQKKIILKTMIIGVDAGALSVRDERLKVGVWRVVVNLLKELGRLDKANTYRLYSFLPIERGILATFGSRMENVVLPQKGWFRFWLPLELMRHPVDCFLGLSQVIPSFAKHSIGFVYDLGFLRFPDAYPASYNSLKKQTEYLVKKSDHIVTISHNTEQDLIQRYNVHKKRLTVCYPGISSQFTVAQSRYQEERPYFLFVGALKRGKNIPLLLEAFAQFLSKTKQECDLYLVGGNYWFDPNIDETISRLSLKSRVKFFGVVSDEKLALIYRGALALVVPSLWEGFCLPVTEAMASGCPVIVSDGGSLPEITGDAGMIVHGNTPEAYASAVKRMVGDKALAKECKKKGLARSKLFSWKTMARRVSEIINRV